MATTVYAGSLPTACPVYYCQHCGNTIAYGMHSRAWLHTTTLGLYCPGSRTVASLAGQ